MRAGRLEFELFKFHKNKKFQWFGELAIMGEWNNRVDKPGGVCDRVKKPGGQYQVECNHLPAGEARDNQPIKTLISLNFAYQSVIITRKYTQIR